MPVGFIGTGNLGSAMVTRLKHEGTELLVWNRTKEKAKKLDVPVAATPKDVATKCDPIILNLFDSPAVRDVLLDTHGLLHGDCKGKIVIDTTTNHFEKVKEFYQLVGDAGATYLESPVMGSVLPATQGNLTIVVSGRREAYTKVLPLLEKLGKRVFYMPKPGQASEMKLINNLVLGAIMATVAEAMTLGEAAGLSSVELLEILSVGAGNSAILNAKRQKLLEKDFTAHFSVAAIYKDLNYLQDLLTQLGKDGAIAEATRDVFQKAMARGYGNEDFAAVYRIMKSEGAKDIEHKA